MSETPQEPQSAAPGAGEQTAASPDPMPAAPAADTPAETPEAAAPDATAEVHSRIADAAHRFVVAVENIYDDTNLRGEVVAAKNEVRDLLARLEGDVKGTPTEPTPTPEAQS